MKTAIIAIAKCENHYIREWVEHYRLLGADRIILGDNNDTDGERLSDVLGDYLRDGFVTIKDCRGMKRLQATFYANMYREYGWQFDWLAFFDCDEFLCLTKHPDIPTFLSDPTYAPFKVIRLNWQCYGDNGLVRVVDGDYSLQKRFTQPIRRDLIVGRVPVNSNSKTFVRGGLTEPNIGVHGCYDERCCNDLGEPIRNDWATDGFSWEVAYLKHYNTKTLEEWLDKMRRGYADRNWNNPAMLSVERFFLYNPRTPEKLLFLRDHTPQP